ncbi:hypothetical protein HOG21_03680 [bacterium]|nr:hypothetical protein [bacterium]
MQENESFIDIRNYIEDEIKRSSTFLFRFLIARSFSKQEIEYFTQENILKNNYLDTNSDPLIL